LTTSSTALAADEYARHDSLAGYRRRPALADASRETSIDRQSRERFLASAHDNGGSEADDGYAWGPRSGLTNSARRTIYMGITCSRRLKTATARAMSRFKRGNEKDGKGRFVPPEVVMGNTDNEANFDKAIPLFAKWGRLR
jgi:hypothetical protein